MNKKVILFLIIGLLFIIIPYIFNTYNIIRLISILVGIILITISLIFYENKNIYIILITPIILIILTYTLDIFLYTKFNQIPIYIYEIKSNAKVSTYNSLFYRIYNCDNKLILDYNYEKKYSCNSDALDEIDINTFLINPINSYKEYKNKFIKITGKISKISGRDTLELNAYNIVDGALNGYVDFNKDYKIVVNLNEDLSDYCIYDYINIVGRVHSYKDGVITLKDAYTIASEIYDEFTYEIINNDNKEIINIVDNYYFYGIKAININYANNNIYELSYLINDAKIDIDKIIEDNKELILNDENNIKVATKYELEKFNILICESDKIIFGNKNYNMDTSLCK